MLERGKRKTRDSDEEENVEPKKQKTDDKTFIVDVGENTEDISIVQNLLNPYTVEEFAVPYPNTFLLDSELNLPEALKFLTQHKLHWAPVKVTNYVAGIIDLRMIVTFVVRTFKHNTQLFQEEVLREISSEEKWHSTTVKQVMKSFSTEKRKGNLILDVNTPLLQAINFMACGQHRFCVTKNKEFYGILSQSDIIRYLARQLDKCGPIVTKSVEELACGLRIVVAETLDAKVIDILGNIDRWKIGGLAIIGPNNILVGNLSVSDLKLVVKDDPLCFACLNITLGEFVKRVRTEFHTNLGTVVACNEYDTLGNVIRILANNHLHHIYIVDANGVLTGVITCNNVLNALIPFESDKGNTSPVDNHLTVDSY